MSLKKMQEKLIRTMAESDNIKRRAQEDVERAHKYALDKFCAELLPVIDSLEQALLVEVEAGPGLEAMRQGIDLTIKLFQKTWEKFGIKQVDPHGQAFDPAFHKAISMQPSPDVSPNTIITVVQKGYLLNDRLVRPALVIVAAGG